MDYNVLKAFIKPICGTILCTFILVGCSSTSRQETNPPVSNYENEDEGEIKPPQRESQLSESFTEYAVSPVPSPTTKASPPTPTLAEQEPHITDANWGEYFRDLNGAAVIYNASDMHYTIYQQKLAETRRSPCSTFKIISSLIALENGVIEPENSTRTWGREIFWNENWNRDIDFNSAFRTSCIWYFREIIDELGKEKIQEGLDRLEYGNRDISDWEGRLNTNNNNRALTGFWVESSLLISPWEQTEVMARIFGENSVYLEKTRQALKEVMKIDQSENPDICIYGKTGMGKAHGVVVDAWFTGFAENPEKEDTIYFCVYLGQSDNKDFTSTTAKEIAIHLISEYWNQN